MSDDDDKIKYAKYNNSSIPVAGRDWVRLVIVYGACLGVLWAIVETVS